MFVLFEIKNECPVLIGFQWLFLCLYKAKTSTSCSLSAAANVHVFFSWSYCVADTCCTRAHC